MTIVAPVTRHNAGSADQRVETLSNVAFERLRSEVMLGNLVPGEKLRIQGLRDRYGIGLIPLREALSRLSETGLVIAEAQRGYRVSPLSTEEFADLIETTLHVETEALSRSIARGDIAWEARVVAAFHRLSLTESAVGSGKAPLSPEWSMLNREFHAQTISACGSKWMLKFCNTLHDQRSRYQNRPGNSTTLPADKQARDHKALLRAIVGRDTLKAIRLLESHIRSEAECLERGLAAIP